MPDAATVPAVDWQSWARRWDRQQEVYLPDRERRFTLMIELVARVVAPRDAELTVIDLACGTGSISRRVLDAFPRARVLGIDLDPALLAIARGVTEAADGRFSAHELDLRGAWAQDLPVSAVDAVLSSTALHWIAPADLVGLYETLGGLIRPGGLFANADQMRALATAPTLAQAVRAVELEGWEAAGKRPGQEDWAAWWDAARAEPGLAALVAERDRRFATRLGHRDADLEVHVAALRQAGFREVGEVFRYLNDGVLVALR